MTILHLEGFDWFTDAAELATRYTSNNINEWYSVASGRFAGSRGVGWDGGASQIYLAKGLPSGDYSTITMGIAAYLYLTASSRAIFYFGDVSGGQIMAWYNDSDGIRITRGTSYGSNILGEVDTVQQTGVWMYYIMKVYIHDTAGTIDFWINGESVISESSLDTRAYGAYITTVRLYTLSYRSQGQDIFDDWWITDGENLGDCRIKTYMPTGDGTYSQFTPSAGSNYENVDDTNPDDDSTYNEANFLNAKDSYTFTPSIISPVKAVQVGTLAKKTGVQEIQIKNLIRSGGSDYNSTDGKYLSTDYAYLSTIHETDPDDSNPWTQSKVSSAEFGLEITAITTTTTT